MPRYNYLNVEVSLDGISPRIWRRFLLRDRASFLDLHQAIQDACGWDNTHLFAFLAADGEVVAGVPNDFGCGEPHPDAGEVPAGGWLKRHGSVVYEYDFGDSWRHTVELIEVTTRDERFTRRLVGGARSFPPEDCGGLPATRDVLAVASAGQARYHDTEMLQRWYGDWDPEAFDLEAVRQRFDR